MIEILKLKDLGPDICHYDYLTFLDDELYSKQSWFGFSVQGLDANISRVYLYKRLSAIFRDVILEEMEYPIWYVLHDDKILPWFNSQSDVSEFPLIAKILHEKKLSLQSKCIFKIDYAHLEKLADEIIKYPSLLSYKNIDCINDSSGLIIKSTSHITIDFISKDFEKISRLKKAIDVKNDLRIVDYTVSR